MGVETLDVVADRGYYESEEIKACEDADITVTLPKPLPSSAKAAGRFGKPDFVYIAAADVYRCPAGEGLTYRYIVTMLLCLDGRRDGGHSIAGRAACRARRWQCAVCGYCSIKKSCQRLADVAAVLKQLGFDVVLATDVDQSAFARQIDNFARRLEGADIGLFYYAGHGLQVNEKNYLVSVNAKLESEFLVPSETIELDAVIRLMESRATIKSRFPRRLPQ